MAFDASIKGAVQAAKKAAGDQKEYPANWRGLVDAIQDIEGGSGPGGPVYWDDIKDKPDLTIGDGKISITSQGGTPVGEFTVNQLGPTTIALPADASFSGDYNDLSNLPVIGEGVIVINDNGGNEVGRFQVNQETQTIITLPASGSGDFSGDYNDLTNKPDIPANTSDLVNDGENGTDKFITANDLNEFSGDYNDLTNKPTIGEGTLTINDKDGTKLAEFGANDTGDTSFNLPATDPVDWNDIDNKPDPPGDGTITLTQNGATIDSFNVDQSNDQTIVIPFSDDSYVHMDSSPPDPAQDGELWWDTTEGRLYVYYANDPGGTSQWVAATPTVEADTIFNFKGTVDATAENPPTQEVGDIYINTGDGAVFSNQWNKVTNVKPGDELCYTNNGWFVIGHATEFPVTSVNGKTGDVVLDLGISEAPKNGQAYVRKDEAWDTLDNQLTDYIKDADSDGKTYGRKDGAWAEIENFDGDYNNLDNKPTIGAGVLSIANSDGDVIDTFSANATANKTITLPAGSGSGDFSGDYNDLTNKPDIPDSTSDLTNDSGFITDAGVTEIAAGTGISIDQATGKVTITNTGGSDFSGDYNDLTNKPDIPDSTSDLTNDSGFITAGDIPAIPDKTSDLTNDSGFITADDIPDPPSLDGYATETWVEGKGYITDAGVTEIAAGSGISIDQATGKVTITNTGGSQGGTSVHVGPQPNTDAATSGDLWFNEEDGRLYVYYVDDDNDEYWVPTNPVGIKGDKGEPGKDGASVVVDDTPPALADSTEGDLYWDTEDGQLYIAYSDTDTDQWVPASPAVKGKDGADFTYDDFTADQLAALKGPKGDDGDTPNVQATAATGAAGSSATVTRSGTDANPTFNFTIPKGDDGAPGSAADVPEVKTTTSADDIGAGTLADRDSAGDLNGRSYKSWVPSDQIMTNWDLSNGGGIGFRRNNTDDNYMRFCADMSSARQALDTIDRSGGGANTNNGPWGIDINGNAKTADNALAVPGSGVSGAVYSATNASNVPASGVSGKVGSATNCDNASNVYHQTASDNKEYPACFSKTSTGNGPVYNSGNYNGGNGEPRINEPAKAFLANRGIFNSSFSLHYGVPADYRYVTDTAPVENATTLIKLLNPTTYKYNGKTIVGFIAHELSDVASYAVEGEKDSTTFARTRNMATYYDEQTVDVTKLVPLLTKALQEALTRIDELEAKIK